MNALTDLTTILLATRAYIARPDNDFTWSGWRDRASALRELDEIIAGLRAGEAPNPLQMRLLFAPTGPIQEVSISSGWGDEFLKLASDMDLALARLHERPTR